MNWKTFRSIITFLCLSLLSISCEEDDPQPSIPPPITHYLVTFGAGPNWAAGQAIFEQNIAEHFNYQIDLFGSGTLKAAGFLLEDDQGLYIQEVRQESEIDEIISNDPAVIEGIFDPIEKEAISMVAEQVLDSIAIAGRQYFIIEYTPAARWESSKKLWELDLTNHQNYMGQQFSEKVMLRGAQFIEVDKAMYVVLANSEAEVQSIIDNDPAVNEMVFQGTIKSWSVNVDQL